MTGFLKCRPWYFSRCIFSQNDSKNWNFMKITKVHPTKRENLLKVWIISVVLLEQVKKAKFFYTLFFIRKKIEHFSFCCLFLFTDCVENQKYVAQKLGTFKYSERNYEKNQKMSFWFIKIYRCLALAFSSESFGFSALFRDFEIMNSTGSELKHFWIRVDQPWLPVRSQPG